MRYVIIGASAGALAAAEILRQWDRDGSITLISEEPHRPYSRPLLTYLLSGEVKPEQIWLRPEDYWEKWGFQALLGEPVVQVDPQAHAVHLAGGRACPYDRLFIASGAEARRPDLPGQDLTGVYTLRLLKDWQRLDEELPKSGAVAVVGAGPVGLKATEALVKRGLKVILLEAEARAMPHLLDESAAAFLHQALLDLGVELNFKSRPTKVLGDQGRVRGLALADGREVAVQAVLFAIGVTPRTDFLAGTGLAGPAGIQVDEFMQTAHPDIYAAGDCARPRHLLTGEPASYQIWPAAVAQGQVAGANLAGARRRYDGLLPQNSLSLGDLKIISGGLLNPPEDQGEVITQYEPRQGLYRRLVLHQDRLVGVTLIGNITDAGIYFQLLAQRLPVHQLTTDPRAPDFHPGRLWG
ncbi:MAG: FAD-dependent oxidoreductase [Thermodesulfobacteriota bacterium]